ncbi:MAG: hypothetical protein RLZ18_548 [Actinomycetota bacterium]
MIRKHFLTYLALSTVGISQPLLDLYGKNGTVFSTAKLSPLEVAVFLVVVALGPATGAVALDRFSKFFGPKVNESMRLLLIGGFSFLSGLAIARWAHLSGDIPTILISGILALLVPVAFDKKKWAREWSRWLSVLSVVVLASAVLQLQPILLQQQGPQSDAVVGNKEVSVLQIVLDEFSLAPLLDAEGNINAQRFPGFAELAATSTWYRNNVSASNFTHQAVPAILSSQTPSKDAAPFLSAYPRNIFTLFGGKIPVSGVEPVTSLCPVRVCPKAGESRWSLNASRLKGFFRDASYVYGQRVFPPALRKRIPSVDGAWGGFGAVANKFKEQYSNGALSQPDALLSAVGSLVDSAGPQVSVVHALVPHAPWRLTPDMRVAPLSPTISTMNPDSADGIRDEYQTYLYQVGAVDAVIQKALKELKSSGRWNNTMIVLTADHGISFIPTMPQRHTDFTESQQVADIYRIPTFIKYPNQNEPVVSDCASTNLDLLPTIIDVTNTKTSWSFKGQSLANSCPERNSRRVISATGESADLSTGFEDAQGRAAHYAEIVSNDGPINKIASVGASAALIGTKLPDVATDQQVTGWKLLQKKMFMNVSNSRGADVPSLVTGSVQMSGELPAGTEGIVAIDGVAAGVIGELSNARDVTAFTSILDYSLLTPGKHIVELYVRSAEGVLTRVGQPA